MIDLLARYGLDKPAQRSISVGARRLLLDLCGRHNVKSALELGTYKGLSAAVLATTADKVVTVDIEDWGPQLLWDSVGLADKIEFHCMDSIEYLPREARRFDLAFIDSGHDPVRYPNGDITYFEIMHCLQLVRAGGVILLDDVFPDDEPIVPGGFHCPGPWMALESLRQAGVEYTLIQKLPDGSDTRMALIEV